MSAKSKREGRSLADQSKRGKVVGKKIISSKKENDDGFTPDQRRLNKLGVVDMVNSMIDGDKVDEVLEFVYGYAKDLYGYESIFEPKYLLEVLIENIATMSEDLSAAFEYINSVTLTELILLSQLTSYLSDNINDDVTDYVLNRVDYFDPNTYEGKTHLIEFVEYVHEHNGDISKIDENTSFDIESPAECVKEIRDYCTNCQNEAVSVKGVEGLGYCTDCNVNVLIVEEIQDRCGDEQKSIYISCANCRKRGNNIKYFRDE